MKKDGDLRPYIRSVKKIAGSDFSETYISEQLDVAEKVVETLENVKNITKDDIINIRKEQKELGNNLERTTELMVAKINAKNARNEPLVYIDKALEFINNIDLDVLNMMNRDKLAKRKFIKKLNDLEDAFNLLKECLDE
jgi:hypothetical protein